MLGPRKKLEGRKSSKMNQQIISESKVSLTERTYQVPSIVYKIIWDVVHRHEILKQRDGLQASKELW